MDCTQNRFCRGLNESDRAQLCACCTKRTWKKGQIIYRADIESRMTVIVDGFMSTQTDFSDEMMDQGDCPCFFINTSGLVLGVENLFNDEPIKRYNYISYECMTDCVTAYFPRSLFQKLHRESYDFSVALFKNVQFATYDACEFAAALRVSNVQQCIRYLLKYCTRKGIRMNQVQMAAVTGHSRASVSDALSGIKRKYPGEWEKYLTGTQDPDERD